MKVECKKIDKNLLAKMTGELDHHFAKEVREKIDREYTKQACLNIVLDFSEVNFMDSSGIGMIIGRYKMALEKGGKVVAFGLIDNAKRIFDMSGLNKLIQCYNTKEEAIKSL